MSIIRDAIEQAREPEQPSRQQPIPLIPIKTPEPEYPLDALGSELGAAARAIADVVQCPRAIAGQSVIAAVSLVAQGFYNVVIDGRSSPLSLFFLTVAESGDRKSAADAIATQPIHEQQEAMLEQYREEWSRFRAEQAAYDSELSKIKGNKKSDFREKLESILALGEEPTSPTAPRFLCTEPTLEGLQKSYLNGQPAQGLFSDEGGQFFGGHAMNPDAAMRSVSGISKFWDGNRPIDRMRAGNGESMMLYNRRLAIHLMVQPVIADQVLSDPLLMQQGFLARFLIASTDSLAGTRLYNHRSAANSPEIKAYQLRLKQLLNESPEVDDNGGLVLADMELSSEAHSLWVSSYNAIERQIGSNGKLQHIKPAAAKLSENVARMAGVLAFYDGKDKITAMHMRNAIKLGNYYLNNYLRLADAAEQDTELRQANDLLAWVKARGSVVSISDIGKTGPRSCGVRSVKRARRLMALLEEYGHVATSNRNQRNQPDEWEVIEHV